MHQYVGHLDQGLMIGVGAVFLYMAGVVKKSPEWIKDLGLRWLYRLIQEPKRFNHFISTDILRFMGLAFKDLVGKK